jgi:tight adherence protein C
MLEWIVLGCVFVFVFGVSLIAVRRFTSDEHRIDVRLANGHANSPPQGYQEPTLLLGDLTQPLGSMSLPGGDKKSALEKELREAGYYSSKALLEYSALRAMLIGVPIFGCLIVAIVADAEWLPYIAGTGLILAILGYSVPRVYLNYLASQRNRQIERGLPVAIDLLSLCLTGGQNVLTGLTRVSRDLDYSFPVLAQELRIVHRHADMVGLEMALQQLANRTNVQEVKNLSVILTHTERLGTDLSTALLEFSTNFRQTLRQRAEEQANRVSFWMLFPTIFCLLLPALVLFNAPLFYEFSKARKELSENYNQGMQSLNELKKESANKK